MPPRFQISSHVLGFTLACIPCIYYGYYMDKNHKSDEEFEEILREKYADNIQRSKNQRSEMIHFFEGVKNPGSNPDVERRLQEVLRGGKDDSKRLYAVDEKLYGTEEGVKLRHEAEEKVEQQKKKQKKKKKPKKKKNLQQDSTVAADDAGEMKSDRSQQNSSASDKGSSDSSTDANMEKKSDLTNTTGANEKSALTLVAVGALAATVGILLGGKRSQ